MDRSPIVEILPTSFSVQSSRGKPGDMGHRYKSEVSGLTSPSNRALIDHHQYASYRLSGGVDRVREKGGTRLFPAGEPTLAPN